MTTQCVDDHLILTAHFDSHGELSDVCTKVVLKYFHLAQSDGQMLFGLRPLWQRSVTKWKKACDVCSKGRSARSEYVNRPADYRHIVMFGMTLHVASMACSQTLQSQVMCNTSKQRQETLYVFFSGTHSLVPISLMCKIRTHLINSWIVLT